MSDSANGAPWWERRHLGPGDGLLVSLDTLDLALWRAAGEWQVAHGHVPPAGAEPRSAEVRPIERIPESLPERARFASDGTSDEVRYLPRVADRSVVARPRVALHVLAGERARIYVSSPVWVAVAIGEAERILMEAPTRRLSDTWFGSSTRDGVVAYSLKTQARTRAADMPYVSFRAVTPVDIRNESGETLTVDRINLPVPYLSIYEGDGGRLWTEPVELRHGGDSDLAALDVRHRAPSEAGRAVRLSSPRQEPERSVVVRAFSTLWRPFESGGDA